MGRTDAQGYPWQPVGAVRLAGASAGILLLFVLVLGDRDGFIPIIDHANLVFHEAGHVIFGFLGRTMALYGGTLGQLVFPLTAGISFWMRREPVSCALMAVWFFQNWLNIARYMADARAQLLPLVGGGGHDWHAILSRWGLLSADTTLAAGVKALGWLGMIGALGWLAWRWWQDREK